MLDILESFSEFFGDEVPSDIDERNEIINSWSEEGPESKASSKVDEFLMPLLDPVKEKLNSYLKENGIEPVYDY